MLVLVVGFEPTRYYYQQILSLPRLPIPSYQHIVRNYLTHNYLRLRIVDWSRFPLASSPPGICSPKYFSVAPTTAPFVQPGALCWPQNLVYLVRQTGIEPVTYRLKGDYSANWVTGAYGGIGEDRTPDLLIANQTFSQLNYDPMWSYWQESNLQPTDYKSVALPVVLQ